MGKQYSQRASHKRSDQSSAMNEKGFKPGDLVHYADGSAVNDWTGLVIEVSEVTATVFWGHEKFIWVHDSDDLKLSDKVAL